MSALADYIERKNFFVKIFKQGRTYDVNNLSHSDKTALRESIDCDLSPENLFCDGERPRAQAMAIARDLEQALKELDALA
jgi:hypothetical protein